MKQLLILRHAKSCWDNPDLADIERPLAKRGLRDAPTMGRALQARGLAADLVLCSDAQRTRETWSLLAPEWLGDKTVPFQATRSLYMASAKELLKLCKTTEAQVQRLMLIGHNPGLHELCLRLIGTARDPNDMTQLVRKLPTAAFVLLSFPTEQWSMLQEGTGHLELFLKPRDIQA
ncbi:SixA phosphatase family protein [Fodinicurvata fenggangensis]|uniref:SixA phosphatase family protein n=1 Tax=Fodinicurvata fenggangensis TaxID=1121830 RepID=UPI00047E4FC1|nr:histidine phosphatase family protein [Fodinicurvata fenggangensis]